MKQCFHPLVPRPRPCFHRGKYRYLDSCPERVSQATPAGLETRRHHPFTLSAETLNSLAQVLRPDLEGGPLMACSHAVCRPELQHCVCKQLIQQSRHYVRGRGEMELTPWRQPDSQTQKPGDKCCAPIRYSADIPHPCTGHHGSTNQHPQQDRSLRSTPALATDPPL